jgi:hypothetical protein
MVNSSDFPAAIAAWTAKFAGAEGSLDATWELAGIEERWADSLFLGGEPGSAGHYHAALRALVPPGTRFESREENDRRMEAHTRISNKLYDVGPDGRARSYKPPVAAEGKTERRETVHRARRARTKRESELGRVHQFGGHHHDYELGAMWHDAANALAPGYPAQASSACDWSRHYFELYNKAWTAHLPASRWDSDGEQEISEVLALKDSLATSSAKLPPAWVAMLIDGELRRAIAAFPKHPPPPEFEPLAAILADARKLAGR